MNAWVRHHLHSLGGALRRFASTPFATLFNAVAIAVSLVLPLGAYIALYNVQILSGFTEEGVPQMNVFLDTDASLKDRQNVEALLRQSPAVRSARFVSKDEALVAMKRSQDMAEVAGVLKTNPLPDAFVVDLRSPEAAPAETLSEQLRATPHVALVQLDTEWLRRVDALLGLGKLAVSLLAGLLAFALVAVTFNTVRMQILTQADEIEISRLIGATPTYIRRPFYYQGALLGLLGGALALGLIVIAGLLLQPYALAVAQSYGSEFNFRLPPWSDLSALLLFSAGLGGMGAWLSVSRHLLNSGSG
ncbi:MAG TPA: permease-like cell division protein FtsX [Burkholderiales bacterium]|nr:permease-like cell division protein FtsX [Burkholderiales bacterium]